MKNNLKKGITNFMSSLLGEERFKSIALNRTEKKLLSFFEYGYLLDIGWVESSKREKVVDSNGFPLPWLTYPFIQFLESRLHKDMNIFEYGSGNSTLYYASKVNQVTSVEHNQEWYNLLKDKMPNNVSLLYKELDQIESYSKTINETNKKYHIVIIDGRQRVNCTKYIIDALSKNGVIIFDNSERERYAPGIQSLQQNGFKSIEFWGLQAGFTSTTCTSLFYKKDNCFNI